MQADTYCTAVLIEECYWNVLRQHIKAPCLVDQDRSTEETLDQLNAAPRGTKEDALSKQISASSQPIHDGLPLAGTQSVARDETSVLSDRTRNDETHAGNAAKPGVHGTLASADF